MDRIKSYKSAIRVILVASGHKRLGDAIMLKERYGCHGLDLVVVENDEASPGEARNSALPFVNSPWFAFWDDDDMPNVQAFLDLASKTPDNHVGVGQYTIHNSTDGELRRVTPCHDVACLLIDTGFWRLLFPQVLLDKVKFPDLRLGEDRIMVGQLIEEGTKFTFSDEVVYEYRKGHKSITTQILAYDIILSLKEQIRLMEESRNKEKISLMTVSIFLSYLKNGPNKLDILRLFIKSFFRFPIIYLWAITRVIKAQLLFSSQKL